MPCHIEAKVSLLVVSFFPLKTMSMRALVGTSNWILSFGNCSTSEGSHLTKHIVL